MCVESLWIFGCIIRIVDVFVSQHAAIAAVLSKDGRWQTPDLCRHKQGKDNINKQNRSHILSLSSPPVGHRPTDRPTDRQTFPGWFIAKRALLHPVAHCGCWNTWQSVESGIMETKWLTALHAMLVKCVVEEKEPFI